MVVESRIENPETLNSVFDALREDGLIATDQVAIFCREKVASSLTADGQITEFRWLRKWLAEQPTIAWAWYEQHIGNMENSAAHQIGEFARQISGGGWVKKPALQETVEVLVRIYSFMTTYLLSPDAATQSEDSSEYPDPIVELRQAIPRILVQIPGSAANRALIQLVEMEADPRFKSWLNGCVLDHAKLEVPLLAHVAPDTLNTIGEPFLTEPRNEAQLFQQVVARLEEIRKCVEEGPFSDRDLFRPGMPEKHLQLWLAARLRDTQHHRFSVHREEDVDDDKQTDIQLSCQFGNVCIEIKPLDDKRSYSANSLVGDCQKFCV